MQKKQENPFLNLALNILIPTIILSKCSDLPNAENAKFYHFGPIWSLIIALSFPIIYGIWDFISRKTINFISILGLVSVLLTGTLGLFKAKAIWIALKEAILPAIFGIAILISSKINKHFIKTMFYTPQLMDVELIDKKINEKNKKLEFNQLLTVSNNICGYSMFLSSIINFFYAKYKLTAPPGTAEFNKQLAWVTGIGSFFIGLFIMIFLIYALLKFTNGVGKITGLERDDIFNPQNNK